MDMEILNLLANNFKTIGYRNFLGHFADTIFSRSKENLTISFLLARRAQTRHSSDFSEPDFDIAARVTLLQR